MNALNDVISYVLGFKAYVLLPIIILVFSLIFRLKLSQAIKSALTIGVGFIGIFVIFGFFIESIGPAVKSLLERTGLQLNTLDVGWPPMAAITWSYNLAPILMVLIIAVNAIMLILRLTKTVNIDIWNFWHFIFLGALVYETTGSISLSIAAALTASVVTIKLADWSAQPVEKFSGLSGISISTLSAVAYYPIGVLGDKLLSKIPFVNKFDANPETIKKRLNIIGEPMVIGFFMGVLLGTGAGYEVKGVLQLAFEIAAVIYILPMMCGILGQGLMPISEGMKEFMKKKFPNIGDTYIGLDNAVILGNPSVIVTALLLMPMAIMLAFILPGVNFIPLGDLANMVGVIVMVVVAVRGNIIRGFIIGIPIIIGNLYMASQMAGIYTGLARKAKFEVKGYDGAITSFLDGGNILRVWMVRVFSGNMRAIALIPVAALVLYITWRDYVKSKNSIGSENNPE